MDEKKLVKTLTCRWSCSMDWKYVSLQACFFLTDFPRDFGKENVSLYQNDWLGVLRNILGPTMECTWKKIIRVFLAEGLLHITSECNFNCTDFLDVCCDLNKETYIPYCQSNNTPLYIHAQSNHPTIVEKCLPQMIGQKISDLFCDKAAFEKAAPEYK